MKTHFAPQLIIPSRTFDINFYIKGLGAIEIRRFSNSDSSIHVSELSIDGALFHLHEEKPSASHLTPMQAGNNSVIVGLFVRDVDEIMKKAEGAGATVVMPATNFDYGYRQGQFKDPFGHLWMIEKEV